MRKQLFFMAAASALVFASCSSDSNEPNNEKPVEKQGITVTTLDLASQAGRVKNYNGTRGIKHDRLQLVSKIAPVAGSDIAQNNWSATGIAVSGNKAYVSWHSNHQASVAATQWGGAIDVLDLSDMDNLSLTTTKVSKLVKFNNVVVDGTTLYFPLTNYQDGANVGRLADGSNVIEKVAVPGSSANAIKIEGNDLYVVTGYKGGAFKISKNFVNDAKEPVTETIAALNDNFGGKYIDGGYILRTDAEHAYLLPVNGGSQIILSAPLTSQEKFAESYDGKNWVTEGSKAAYYGKHTMAVDAANGVIYVAGGGDTAKGTDNGENGLRAYDMQGNLLWQNGTYTTAVCMDSKYVYAATDAGLRVYKKYNAANAGTTKELVELYAMEVLDYDLNGNNVNGANSKTPVAGTDAHSCNFVAVNGSYIYMANGQSGVYVFKLNEIADVE